MLYSAGTAFFIAVLGLALYIWHLEAWIEHRFSGRRWSIPSTVYSDTAMLFPGQKINRSLLDEKLSRLGYLKTSRSPGRKGELRVTPSSIELFLRDLRISSRVREGFPVRITFSDNQIETLTRMESGEPVPLLELEPEELMFFFGPEREQRRLISVEHIPAHVIHAVLAAEDARFYRHRGVDLRAILRALSANVRHRALSQGGSTITQQLAKNYFLTPERTVSRKLKEMLLSLIMELRYEKDEILEIYLNEIYLGQKGSVAVNGLGEAASFYFGKDASELSLAEGATIAGLIKAPNIYSPYVNRERSLKRRNQVLRAMKKNRWISGESLLRAFSAPLEPAGSTAYRKKAPYFMDYLSQQLSELYSPEILTTHGLSIHTTLDTQVQAAAESALERGLARLEESNPALRRSDPNKQLQGAVIVMQPKTGYILAMVGGRDYNTSVFNRATQAWRQPGSAFKPFVYLAGLDQFTPASPLSNKPRSFDRNGKVWQPRNYEPIAADRIPFRQAFARSVNVPTVNLAVRIGLGRIVETAASFGFSTPVKPYPSLALGAFEVVPLELARAYSAFAADGMLTHPLSLKEISDEQGNVLKRRQMRIEQVIPPEKAFLMGSLLRSAVDEGTGRSLRDMGIAYPVGGKTGTTNEFRDAWFVGFTPDVLALVWVGFDDGASVQAAGSAAALPIWTYLMKALPQYRSGEWLRTPPGVVRRIVCSESGRLAVKWRCPEPVEELFLADHTPTEYCLLHRRVGPWREIIQRVRDFIENL